MALTSYRSPNCSFSDTTHSLRKRPVTSQRGTIHDQRDHPSHDNNCHVDNQQLETQTMYSKGSNGLRLQRERSRRNECQRRFLRASGYPSTLRHRRRPFPLRVAVHPT